ncbi:MAG TPA: tRNA uridine-5-carboxymethylaminomethyl(34) synthesis GTPase MnmE [Balneola sp.]|jgi:tRNA modification GTPase|nr:tRNA uridine-5-carboxymethylaminomethyl(34) synthesis GTPase MnmE [Balneola sp.]MAO77735.1 tRNA uridine-5-carboxymethylaminomethyl(34) synthesis GTPase MnmE [Balneola sp.]MBF63876.1 tRNA uridine-5-carboxymethylaminomethyl(34) synthesis GTPase MnmE [Balneola sp.]HAH52380.1 tRNA uridine-5-carboxymethylaminomethyl(34) synthesis GTPase MnmE [Balneola sp.]HBZ37356.1 tRNA uridine-5-carboxymethylaminomethyl(34) synthesis GTPase MnmE [Balneola sp.]|tara:strand:+ start:10022 stop:11413 length:1392 start_codon:yes stop_codon:yes gene_type:complete
MNDTKKNNSIIHKSAIAAIATPVGEGGIAVIRVSGKDTISIVNQAFQGKDLTSLDSHTIHFGKIVDKNNLPVDEVLISLFHSPRSYTGEETVEISCHGGVLVTQKVLETILSLGVKAAEAGEFTQRAFLNGKLDLEQAEAVADIIHAKSIKAVDAAHQQLQGKLGDYVRSFRQQIIDATAMIELELDFIEEDVEFANKEQLRKLLQDVDTELTNLLDTYETGRLVKDGVKTVLIGRPNAGKSTLLNTLVGSDRAIVTEIAGTTRDTIDVDWNFDGLLFKLIDTAGLRETEDVVEAEGVKRSQKAFEQADLVIYLKDLSQAFTEEERKEIAAFQKRAGETPFILIGTKADIEADREWRTEFDLKISAVKEENIKDLKILLKNRALENKHYDASSLLVTSSRHRDALLKTKEHIQAALTGLDNGLTGDFLSIDLRAALNELGTVTGEITNEHILDSIFSRFCIGK